MPRTCGNAESMHVPVTSAPWGWNLLAGVARPPPPQGARSAPPRGRGEPQASRDVFYDKWISGGKEARSRKDAGTRPRELLKVLKVLKVPLLGECTPSWKVRRDHVGLSSELKVLTWMRG